MTVAALASLVAGIIIGFVGQRSRMCFVAGIRDWILVRDSFLLKGLSPNRKSKETYNTNSNNRDKKGVRQDFCPDLNILKHNPYLKDVDWICLTYESSRSKNAPRQNSCK